MRGIVLALGFLSVAEAFVTPSTRPDAVVCPTSVALNAHSNQMQQNQEQPRNVMVSSLLAASIAFAAFANTPFPSQAYDTADYASDTVVETVKALKDASGNIDSTFKVYESIAEIVTEGKGVGGMINYQGVALERGYVADEDTTLYNPGLTLLTESEKERLVEAIVDSRKVGLQKGQWSENNEFAYDFLKEKLDPLHMYELSGFLGFVPIYGAILYLAVFAVQQFVRDLFPVAYIVGVVAFFLPFVALIAFS